MVMSWIYTLIIAIAVICSIISNSGNAVSAAVLQGAQAGVELAITMAGSICLWSGVGKLMEAGGMTALLSRLLRPL